MNATLRATMRGVVYAGIPFNMTVQDLPMPTIQASTDAIVKITTSALCGSDLHVYRGVQGGTPPWNMGHEAIGYILQTGSAVSALNVGDYVIIPDAASHGHFEQEIQPLDFFGNGATLTQGLQCDTVAVFSTGPIRLLAAYSAILRGASRVYTIDHVADRLGRAAYIGAVPINFATSDPVAQILDYEPNGVMRVLDCVGMEALNATLQHDETIVLRNMVAVAHQGAAIAQVGVFSAQPNSPGAPLGDNFAPNVTFPLASFFVKSLSFRSGAVDPKLVAPQLIDLISSGKASPSFISSASIGIEQVPEYYEKFNKQEELKVYIHFP